MARKKTSSTAARRSVNDVILVAPAAKDGPIQGVARGQRALASLGLSRPLKELEREWSLVTRQVAALLTQTSQAVDVDGFRLDEVSFQIGINAKGQIGLVVSGEFGGEASMTLTFKRDSG
jgi:hypothetical protein